MTKTLWKAVSLSIALPTLSTTYSTALGQTADVQVLEEIVVTARRRVEVLQDVPISMTAFTRDDIDSAGIETPHDFIALTPNVTVIQVQNAGNSFVTVRGISQNRNTEPSVATLVDGVLMSNPAQFNQELFDIEQIEVLRGPQGAVYGRNAIGGAILINTRMPTDEFEGRLRLGADSGPGYKLQGSVGGPVGESDAWSFRGAISLKDTDGYLDNVFLNDDADPYKDVSGRIRFLYEPSDNFSADFRASFSNLETRALYYQIRESAPAPFPGAPEAFGRGSGHPDSVNDTSQPIRNNNAGVNDRDLTNLSLKLDWQTESGGTLTSITSVDTLEELLTGDAWDFLPIDEAVVPTFFGFPDQNQSQWLDLETVSQEIRFTSSAEERLRWIAGAFAITTDRFISTGAMVDTGQGLFPVFREPRGNFPFDFATDPVNPQASFLADEQDNFAWAVFGELAYDFSDQLEGTFSLRYDEDERENTTITPTPFLPVSLSGIPQEGVTGEIRKKTWDDLQPRVSLRYSISDTASWYGSLSRGFRSGGFNQTGVETVAMTLGFPGVGDTFDQEITETFEVGYKGVYNDGRLTTNVSVFHTEAEGTYFFIFIADNSTQNLGNLLGTEYTGLEFDLAAAVNDNLDFDLGIGFTDSEVTASLHTPDLGDKAPNVPEYTLNLGLNYRGTPSSAGGGRFFARGDYQVIGETSFWDFNQNDTNDRSPVHLLDFRVGWEVPDDWSITLWGKNALDEEYHTEYSTGGFVFKALPARFGIDYTKEF